MFQFEWVWLFLFSPLPWVIRLLLPAAETRSAALKIPFYHQWLAAHGGKSQYITNNSPLRYLYYFAWLLLITAAAKPVWIGDPVSLPTTGRDIMLAIDLSGSMEQADFVLNGERVDRLTAVKAVAGDFIVRRKGDRIGLILFGKRAYVQTPLTFDLKTVQFMLNESEIGLAGKETAIGDGIGLAVKRLQERPQESRVLILLTDGANTAGEVEPIKAAELARDAGLKIYTIGVGADSMDVQTFFGTQRFNPSADLDEATLTTIAKTTGGMYFRAKDTLGLENIYAKLDALEPAAQEAETMRPETALYYWPLLVAVCLVLIASATSLLRVSRMDAKVT